MGFYTSKWIEIPDSNIGRVFNALLALLLGVVVYKSVYNKAFLEYDTPVGFVNAKITGWNAPETPPAYCTSHPKIPCRVLDEYEAQYPTTEGDSITLTTRVKEVVDEQQQNGTWVRKSSQSFFTEAAEHFVVKLEHSFEAPHFFHDLTTEEMQSEGRLYAGSSRNMQGVLKYASGKKRAMPSGQPDKFTIGELVEAAGIDLEQTSDGKTDEDEDIRSRGMVLMMHITYTNTDKASFPGLEQPTYKYKVHKVPYAEYKAAQPFGRTETSAGNGRTSGATRTLWKRYGIRVMFVQTGRIARFSWNALLMEIVAGLTLLSVAQLVCDTYAYYMRPELKKLMVVQEYSNADSDPDKVVKPESGKSGKKD